ncbi:MAG TPA: hypothetical protein VF817_00815 [Patescibacteria group bacterium]
MHLVKELASGLAAAAFFDTLIILPFAATILFGAIMNHRSQQIAKH